jgi:DNA polymerase I
VDAHNLIYQVFHALPEMTSPMGMPVGAIHGFTRDMRSLIEKHRPDYLFCAFDHPDPTFRHELYAKYKERRESMPEDLRPQIGGIRRMLTAMGIPQLSVSGYEADDLLATVARQTREQGGTCYLVTGDKDCWQLIGDQVKLYNIRKSQVLDVEALRAHWGIRPDQVVDFQALVGDKIDDIPGVPLIGPKVARELLEKYDHLPGIFEHLEEVPGKKRRENLAEFQQQALLSRQLVRLADDVPVKLDWQQARVGNIQYEEVAALCREFGFRRLAEDLAGPNAPAAALSGSVQYYIASTPAELDDLLAELRQAACFSMHLEVDGGPSRHAVPRGWGFCCQPSQATYLPLGDGGIGRSAGELAERLRGVLEDPQVGKGGHDLKRILVQLRGWGIRLQGLRFDTMVADYLLSPGQRTHDLEDVSRRYLNYDPLPAQPATRRPSGRRAAGRKKQPQQADTASLPSATDPASSATASLPDPTRADSASPAGVPEPARRGAERADLPMRMFELLERQLEAEGLEKLYRDVELPLMEVLAEMEFHGIRIDTEGLGRLSSRFAVRLEQLQSEILDLAGQSFNIDSPRQLAEILFQKLGLPVVKRTPKNEPSTDAEVLEELAGQHELPAKIVEYRQLAKLKGTYVDALPQLVHPATGRIHTTFSQDVAATGRLSSRDPNLQNIPIRTEVGREIRRAFLPAEGWRLMTADYSQIELRMLAHFSLDEALLESFRREEDIHARVASQVFGIPLEQVPGDLRRRAKAVNFGIIYGQTSYGLAKALGIGQEEAAAFIEAYFHTYPGVQRFMEEVLDECRAKGYVTTILGRRRGVEGVRPREKRKDARVRTLPERIAINTVIQGSAADLIKLAMLGVHARLQHERWRTRLLLQIHDELVFEVPPEELEAVAKWVPEEMTAAIQLRTPLQVDVKSGENWGACEPTP